MSAFRLPDVFVSHCYTNVLFIYIFEMHRVETLLPCLISVSSKEAASISLHKKGYQFS